MSEYGSPEFEKLIAQGERRAAQDLAAAVPEDPVETRVDDRVSGSGGRVDPGVVTERLGGEDEPVSPRTGQARDMLRKALRGEIPPPENDDQADPDNVARSQRAIAEIRQAQVEGLLTGEAEPREVPQTVLGSKQASMVGKPYAEEKLREARRRERSKE